jgi:hypothetical protein
MVFFDLFKSNFRPDEKVIWSTAPDEIKKEADAALAEIKKGNFLAALSIYKRMITDYPEKEVLRNNAGCCLANLGKVDEAETEFIESLRLTKLNRDKGLHVPRSYPEEPKRNLIKLYKMALPKNQVTYQLRLFKENIKRLMRFIKREGVAPALIKIPKYLHLKLNPVFGGQEEVIALRAEEFDRKNNVDTAGAIFQAELEINNANKSHSRYYRGSDSLFFNNALTSLKIDFHEYTFIDFGSGKGKALFLASAFSFKKIIGIEFAEDLDAVAQENIRQFKKDNIAAYCMDALEYKIPGEPLVCYFYDPFDEYIMAKVIGNIRQAYDLYKRNIVIVYNNTTHYGLFDAEKWLNRLNSVGPVMMWSADKPRN